MTQKNTKSHKARTAATTLSICAAAVLAACATTGTNQAVENARMDVSSAASNPDVVARAPLELRTAQEALNRADRANRENEPVVEVNHHAYLASVRAQTAQDLAASRRATDELSRAQAEVDRVRLAARTREANVARADAADARNQAALANQYAANANREAQIAAQQAQSAAQQAEAERVRAQAATADAAQAREKLRVLIIEMEGKETERGLLVTLGDVLFVTGRAELLPTAQPRMDKLAAFLQQFPEKNLLIEGYTDSVGSDSTNQQLSERRAEAVRAALTQRGIDNARMVTRGYGESFPVANNGSPEGRAMNRRVEVVVSDDRGTPRPRVAQSTYR